MKDRIGTIPIPHLTVSSQKGYYITINQTYIAIFQSATPLQTHGTSQLPS